MSVSDERVDYLLTLIRAIAREEAQNAVNNPTEQWEPIDPDAAADNYRAALDHIADAMMKALRPFAQHVGKSGEQVTLTIGKDTWTGTLTTVDFERARTAMRGAAPLVEKK